MTNIPRPHPEDPEVKVLSAEKSADDLRVWAESVNLHSEDIAEFVALVALAMKQMPDAYTAGRYLEDLVGWPTDMALIHILDQAYKRTAIIVTDLIHAWVMENNVRFPANKGQGVKVQIGDSEFSAKVSDVISREARAICHPTRDPSKCLVVNAEEVLQVYQNGGLSGPGGFPTGGTPVASQILDGEKIEAVA